MATHIKKYFHPIIPVKAEQILTAAALTSIHELVPLSLGDPGDGILVSTPMYGRFELDFGNTAGLEIVYADMGGVDPFSSGMFDRYQLTLDESAKKGVKVRAFLIVNPNNPLGK
jgi:histidinol-phosphate/aromatic aminotransferase/cobyric acid decarboxylase-like protein